MIKEPTILQNVIESFNKIKELKNAASGASISRPSSDWKVLFDFYNMNLTNETYRRLGMSCAPCYGTVFNRVEEYLNSIGVNNA